MAISESVTQSARMITISYARNDTLEASGLIEMHQMTLLRTGRSGRKSQLYYHEGPQGARDRPRVATYSIMRSGVGIAEVKEGRTAGYLR